MCKLTVMKITLQIIKDAKSFKKILSRTKPKAKKINKENHSIPTSTVSRAPRRSENKASSLNSNEKPSYTEITANKPTTDQSLHIITKFLDELKSILNPLLIALTSLIIKMPIPISPSP